MARKSEMVNKVLGNFEGSVSPPYFEHVTHTYARLLESFRN